MCGYGKACHAQGNMGHVFTPWDQAEMRSIIAQDQAEEEERAEELKARLRDQLAEAFAEHEQEQPTRLPWLRFLVKYYRVILALPLIWMANKVAGTRYRIEGEEQ
jgi:hypothetical protein